MIPACSWTHPERGYHQAIGPVPQRLGEAAVVAQHDRREADPHPPRGVRTECRCPAQAKDGHI